MLKKITTLTGHNASVYALAPGKDDRHFLSGSGDGWIVEWSLDNPENGRLLATADGNIFSLCNLSDSPLVVAGNMHGGLHWIDLDNPDRTQNILHHQKGTFALLPHGDYLYSAGGDGILTKWSLRSLRPVESLHLSNQSLRSLAYAPDRNEIAVGAGDHHIYLLDADTWDIKHRIAAHQNSVFTVRYTPDQTRLLSGGRDARLCVWDLTGDSPRNLSRQNAHWYTVNAVAFHPAGHLFATGSRDKTVKIWDSQTYELLQVLDAPRDGGHINSVNALQWTKDEVLVSGGDDRGVVLWGV